MNIIAVIVSLGLLVAGLYIMGESFSIVGFEAAVFGAGILVPLVGILIPIHVLKRIEG